jgi:hypothetical protein
MCVNHLLIITNVFILSKYYENSILFNALTYYEDKYYRSSIARLQEKLRNNKLDDKTRDHFLQTIEKENQNIVEIINSIKTEYMSKLQQFCIQFQVCCLRNSNKTIHYRLH